MHNVHSWKHTTDEGERREIRAVKFGGNWRFQSRLKHEVTWTYSDEPPIEDLEAFHDILFRKYQRRRASYEDVVGLEKWIARRKADQ